MRSIHVLPLLLITVGLVACSGEEKSTSSFSDPIAAMDQADAASAAGNTDTAEAGYSYALENGDTSLQGDALLAMLEMHIDMGNDAAAAQDFARLSSDFTDRVDSKAILRLCDLAVKAATTETGDAMVAFGASQYPEMLADLVKREAAFERIRTEGPGADLSDLGYAGD